MPETHHVKINYGKHIGTPFTRLPLSYLRWMVNEAAPMHPYAKSELERRGTTMPEIEISGHAIDKASLRVRSIWHQTALSQDEGLYSWLHRMTLEAIEKGEKVGDGAIHYQGMKLVIEKGEEFPVLKTIMPQKKKDA